MNWDSKDYIGYVFMCMTYYGKVRTKLSRDHSRAVRSGEGGRTIQGKHERNRMEGMVLCFNCDAYMTSFICQDA